MTYKDKAFSGSSPPENTLLTPQLSPRSEGRAYVCVLVYTLCVNMYTYIGLHDNVFNLGGGFSDRMKGHFDRI